MLSARRSLRSLARRVPAAFGAGLLLLAGCATPPPAPDADVSAYRDSLLWQVQKAGYATSYVLGTIHSTDPSLQALLPKVRRAFDAAQTVAFEVVFDDEGQEKLARATLQPHGRRLEDVLGPSLFRRTAAAVRKYGVPADNLQHLTPLALVGLLTYPSQELYRLRQGEPVLDAWLQQEARRQGKALRGLESYEEQIALFSDMSDAEQVAIVTEMLEGDPESDFYYLLQLYLAGDIAAIARQANDLSEASDPAAAASFNERLIDDRNAVMVERMLPLMAEGATFVAVGAAHLPGEAGILRLLEQQGFTVTRL